MDSHLTTPPHVAYDDLPLLGTHPASRCSWEVFGRDDDVGGFNRLNEASVQEACAQVRHGKVFSLNWGVERPDPPLFSRNPVRRTVGFGYGFADDKLDDFYLQGSTQWDSLTHVCNPHHGFYNDPPRSADGAVHEGRGGIHVWARRGIAGRFVLADVASWRESQNRPIDPTSNEAVSLDDVLGTLEAQGSSPKLGDILLLRFGWVAWYDATDDEARAALAASQQPTSPGLAATEEMIRWLWDSGVAAVAADNPAVEATPAGHDAYSSLHFTVQPLLGIPFGELFVLDPLARDCAEDREFSGLFTSAPLNVRAGGGSPANALCIK